MEVIRINRERIKIMLSSEDIKELNINTDLLDEFDLAGREAFAKILKEARDKCGFISYGRKILVQIFKSVDGGCEMFITKIPEREETLRSNTPTLYYYKFDRLNDLINLSRVLSPKEAIICNLYREDGKMCVYLETSEKIHIYGEFGGTKCNVSTKAYLAEHCKLISNNAINFLSNY